MGKDSGVRPRGVLSPRSNQFRPENATTPEAQESDSIVSVGKPRNDVSPLPANLSNCHNCSLLNTRPRFNVCRILLVTALPFTSFAMLAYQTIISLRTRNSVPFSIVYLNLINKYNIYKKSRPLNTRNLSLKNRFKHNQDHPPDISRDKSAPK